MIKRYFYIFSAALFILITPTTGVKANIDEDRMEALARQTNSPPQGFNYQAVFRDDNGNLLDNQSIQVRFTLTNGTEDVWIETHETTTNAYGMVTLVIGNGAKSGGSASSFPSIDWSVGILIKVEVDSGNGFVDLGTSVLQSVPYAQYAANGLTTDQSFKLAAIDLNAEQNVQADWNQSNITADDYILNKPAIPTDINELSDVDGLLAGSSFDGSFASLTNIPANLDTDASDDFSGSYNDLTDLPANIDTDATDDFSGDYNDLINKPTIPVDINQLADADGLLAASIFDGSFASLTNIPVNLDVDASDDFSGNYNDLTNKPSIPTDINQLADADGLLIASSFNGSFSSLANVPINLDVDSTDDFSGNYNDLSNKPTIPTDINQLADADGLLNASTFDGSFTSLTDVPVSLDLDSSDDFSGSFKDLSDLPVNLDTDATDDFSGSFTDLTDVPVNLDTDASDDFSGSFHDLSDVPADLADGDDGIARKGTGEYSSIGGGIGNTASSNYASVSGGSNNTASNFFATVGGGDSNQASGDRSTVAGGFDNTSGNYYSFVGGGRNNKAYGHSSVIGGGVNNQADGRSSVIGGGVGNLTNGYFSTIPGGRGLITNSWGEVAVGLYNTDASGSASSIVATDRLFIVGNGSVGARHDAMVILKNGNTEINGSLVASSLGVDGVFNLPTTDGTSGQVLSTDGAGNVTWTTISSGEFSGNFEDLTNIPADLDTDATDDFSGSFADLTNVPADLADGDDGIARIGSGGYTSTIAGGTGNIASSTFASISGGGNNTASGNRSSVGGGYNNKAAGMISTVGGGFGNYVKVNGGTISGGTSNYIDGIHGTISGGYQNDARATYAAVGGGRSNIAEGQASSIMGGRANTASGSFTFIGSGRYNIASDSYAIVAGGHSNQASGQWATIGGGVSNTASGNRSTIPGGNGLKAESFSETALGLFNTTVVPEATDSFVATDRLLVVGNGTDINNLSNALVMLKNGNTDINGTLLANSLGVDGAFTLPTSDGTSGQVLSTNGSGVVSWVAAGGFSGSFDDLTNIPTTLDVDVTDDFSGNYEDLNNKPFISFTTDSNIVFGGDADDSFVFGSIQLADIGANTDDNKRMFFNKSNGAFRVGGTDGSYWNTQGDVSFAAGYNNNASGNYSTIGGGKDNEATGLYAVVSGGDNNSATGNNATVGGGSNNRATNTNATVGGGVFNYSSGQYATIPGGIGLKASSFAETAIGIFNTTASGTTDSFVATDRLFVIGNGADYSSKSDAMVVLKNGNTAIYGTLVASSLGVGGAFTLPTSDGSNGQVLGTDGSGNVSWVTVAGGGFSGSFNDLTNVPANLDTDATDDFSGDYNDLTNKPAISFTTTTNVVAGGDSDDDFVFGSTQLMDQVGTSDDSRMFFDKSTAAFRAGSAAGTQWDAVGVGSFATGRNNSALGTDATVSGGYNNSALGDRSTIAGGISNSAAGNFSFVTGNTNQALGSYSTVLGAFNNIATGIDATIAGGRGLRANTFREFVIGSYNTEDPSGSSSSFVATDRLFTIGNGTSLAAQSDAMVMLKNGNTTLNGNMQVNGDLAYSGSLSNSSDLRLKKDITELSDVLSTLMKLEAYRYRYNGIKATDTLAVHMGVIAQELQEVYPELVKTGTDGYLSVNYLEMIPLLLEGIKELAAENTALKAENANLEQRQTEDEQRFAALEDQVSLLMKLMVPAQEGLGKK